MSETPAKKLVDEVVKRSIQPRLKADGYRKKARTFFRELDGGVYQIANVQLNKWNTAQEATFTINLGVYFPSVVAIYWQPEITPPPRECECTVRARIGNLLDEPDDHWWTVTPRTDLDSLAAEVDAVWAKCGRPWLEKHSGLEAARKWVLRQYDKHTALTISVAMSDRVAAKKLYNAILKRHGPDKKIIAFGKKHRLLS